MDWIPELEWWQWGIDVWLVGAVLAISFLYWRQPELPNDEHDTNRGI